MQEDKIDQKSYKINELLQLLSQEDVAHHLIDVLNMLKEWPQVNRPIKNVYKMNHVDKSYFWSSSQLRDRRSTYTTSSSRIWVPS